MPLPAGESGEAERKHKSRGRGNENTALSPPAGLPSLGIGRKRGRDEGTHVFGQLVRKSLRELGGTGNQRR